MLACKAKYFTDVRDYQDFASYLAYDVYSRMKDESKPHIKSCLNYMKQVMYFRKNAYERESYSEIIDTNLQKYENFDKELFVERGKQSIERYNRKAVEYSVISLIESIPNAIKAYIPGVYLTDPKRYHNIYISCLLTMLNEFTLPNKNQEYLSYKLEVRPTFDEVSYYRKHLDAGVIL